MVSGGGLSPGLLGRRRAEQCLLHRGDPAQVAEIAQELPGARQIGGSCAGLSPSRVKTRLAAPEVCANPQSLTGGGGGARSAPFFYPFPDAARRRRSLIAAPRPSSGTGATAMRGC